MWVARDGDQLLAWTPADAWKVKRIRRDPRVTLRPCGRTGKVRAEQPLLAGTAEVITDPGEVTRVESLIKHKYGLEVLSSGDTDRNHCGPRPQTACCPAHHAVESDLTRVAIERVRGPGTSPRTN